MISYDYPNCIACHVSVQGRGLLNSYGRGIDIAQSYSQRDFTGLFLGRLIDPRYASGTWDGRFSNVLADFLVTARVNQRLDSGRTDPTLSALFRQVVFFGERNLFRVNTEIGFRDSGLSDTLVGSNRNVTGGDNVFLKKLLLEWRLEEQGTTSGKELALGRDYLPLGLQIDDYSTFILHLNRNGIYDYPFQLKYFAWDEKSLGSVFIYAPSFDERVDNQEYGGGLLYERYPTNHLALGVQGLAGFGEESDRLRLGVYARWGISTKCALLAEADYTAFWDGEPTRRQGRQLTTFLQLFYHHAEWLVSAVAVNYASSDFLFSKEHLYSLRYTLAARLNRNVTVGVTFANGDILRNLGHAQEGALFATLKF
jgi:hypothetical protein